MEGDYKIVEYEKYCPNCKHYEEDESDPKCKCYECLDTPAAVDSRRPIHYEKKD